MPSGPHRPTIVPVFFTQNGYEIGTVLMPMPPTGFHPAVGLHSEGEEVLWTLSVSHFERGNGEEMSQFGFRELGISSYVAWKGGLCPLAGFVYCNDLSKCLQGEKQKSMDVHTIPTQLHAKANFNLQHLHVQHFFVWILGLLCLHLFPWCQEDFQSFGEW